MKCIQCDTDNNLKDRTANQGRCKNCNHPFVFDPKAGSRFTDGFFNNALKAISAENTLYFTPKQFFYALERRLVRKSTASTGGLLAFCIILSFFWGLGIIIFIMVAVVEIVSGKHGPQTRKFYARGLQVCGGLLALGGIIFAILLSEITSVAAFIFILGIGAGILLFSLGKNHLQRLFYIPQSLYIRPSETERWVHSWTQVNGPIGKMLPPGNEENASVAVSPEVTAYSFDRVVVCDSDSIAQMLIANNFHFENNCAVLSIAGYPQSIFSTVLDMLRRNQSLKVYALHDATPEGVSLLHRLGESPDWFANSNVAIYDLGLLPRHVLKSKNISLRNSKESALACQQLPEPVRQSLAKDELEWLEAGNFVELEFFTPERLLQVLTHGIGRSREPGSDDGMIRVYEDGDYDNTSTSAMIFASDSFG